MGDGVAWLFGRLGRLLRGFGTKPTARHPDCHHAA
jgi:hypothetical protein